MKVFKNLMYAAMASVVLFSTSCVKNEVPDEVKKLREQQLALAGYQADLVAAQAKVQEASAALTAAQAENQIFQNEKLRSEWEAKADYRATQLEQQLIDLQNKLAKAKENQDNLDLTYASTYVGNYKAVMFGGVAKNIDGSSAGNYNDPNNVQSKNDKISAENDKIYLANAMIDVINNSSEIDYDKVRELEIENLTQAVKTKEVALADARKNLEKIETFNENANKDELMAEIADLKVKKQNLEDQEARKKIEKNALQANKVDVWKKEKAGLEKLTGKSGMCDDATKQNEDLLKYFKEEENANGNYVTIESDWTKTEHDKYEGIGTNDADVLVGDVKTLVKLKADSIDLQVKKTEYEAVLGGNGVNATTLKEDMDAAKKALDKAQYKNNAYKAKYDNEKAALDALDNTNTLTATTSEADFDTYIADATHTADQIAAAKKLKATVIAYRAAQTDLADKQADYDAKKSKYDTFVNNFQTINDDIETNSENQRITREAIKILEKANEDIKSMKALVGTDSNIEETQNKIDALNDSILSVSIQTIKIQNEIDLIGERVTALDNDITSLQGILDGISDPGGLLQKAKKGVTDAITSLKESQADLNSAVQYNPVETPKTKEDYIKQQETKIAEAEKEVAKLTSERDVLQKIADAWKAKMDAALAKITG